MRRAIVGVGLCLAFTLGFGEGLSGAEVITAPDSGLTLEGSWQVGEAKNGSWQATLNVEGERISGIVTLPGRSDIGTLSVTGVRSGSEVQLELSRSGKAFGTISGSIDGSHVVGEYEPPSADARGRVEGELSTYAARSADQDPPPTLWDGNRPPISSLMTQELVVAAGQARRRPVTRAAGSGDDLSRVAALTTCGNCIVNVANDLDFPQIEPTLAIDTPNNPARFLAAWIALNTFNGRFDIDYGISADRGHTWARGTDLSSDNVQSFDPVAQFDSAGRPFLAYVGLNVGFDPCGVGQGNDLAIRYSTSSTGTSLPSRTVVAHSTDTTIGFNDKPWLAINRVGGANLDSVYVSWTLFSESCGRSQIVLNRSHTNGSAFDAFPTLVSDVNDRGAQGSNIAIGIFGGVAVAWTNYTSSPAQVMFDQCSDSGSLACGTDQVIASISPLPDTLPGIGVRGNSNPSLAVDNAPGGSGDMFAVWAEYIGSNADVYFARKPFGQGWQAKSAIAFQGVDEFYPTVAVGKDHAIRVIYYRRNSTVASDPSFNTYGIKSTNGGATWTQPAKANNGGDLMPVAQLPGQIGDYISLAPNTDGNDSTKSEAVSVWTDSRRFVTGSSTDHQLDIYMGVGC